MKLTCVKFIGPNTVIGKTSKGLVRARVAINDRPGVGQEFERPDSECSDWKEPKAEEPAIESKPSK